MQKKIYDLITRLWNNVFIKVSLFIILVASMARGVYWMGYQVGKFVYYIAN